MKDFINEIVSKASIDIVNQEEERLKWVMQQLGITEDDLTCRFPKLILAYDGMDKHFYFNDGSRDGVWVCSFVQSSFVQSSVDYTEYFKFGIEIEFTYNEELLTKN